MDKPNKEKKNNKKIILIVAICLVLIILGIVFLKISKNGLPNKENLYTEIDTALEEKTDVIIYYYDSSTDNPLNEELKDYLKKEKIKCSIYDHAKIKTEEYHRVMDRLSIDENVFGTPAIIYVHLGIMYANIININDMNAVKRFVEDYKLTEVE